MQIVDNFVRSTEDEQYFNFCEYDEDCLYKPKTYMLNVSRRSEESCERRESDSEYKLEDYTDTTHSVIVFRIFNILYT